MSKVNAKFQLLNQFDIYLQMIGLKKESMDPIQLQEMKRAFFAGAGQTLILLRDELSEYPDDIAADMLQDMINQTTLFWLSQK